MRGNAGAAGQALTGEAGPLYAGCKQNQTKGGPALRKKTCSTVWLGLILGAALVGCAIKLNLGTGSIHWYQLRYFTTLSNILAGIYALCALLRGRAGTPALLQGGALMGVLVTGIIYHLLLRGTFGGFSPFTRDWLGDQLVHTAVPLLMALDWLLLAPKGRFRPLHPLGWALFPLAYLAGTVAMARTGLCFPNSNTPYPYPFLDVWTLGWGPVVRNSGCIALAFLLLGEAVAALDRRMGKKTERTDVVNP